MSAENIPCREKAFGHVWAGKISCFFSSYAIPFLYFIFLFSIPFKNAVFQISLVLINLSFFVLLFLNKDFRCFFMPYRSFWVALGLLALCMGISNFFGVSGLEGWEEMLKYISRYYPFFFATLYFYHHKKITFSFIVHSLFIVFFLHAFYGLGQYFIDGSFWGISDLADRFGERLSGTTYNPNKFGFIMALSVVFSFATGIRIKQIAPKIPYRFCRFMLILLWLVSFWCLLQSGSRGSWLAAVSGMLLAVFFTPRYLKQKTSWLSFILLLGILFLFFKANPLFQERMDALLAGDSSYRVEVWQDALHYIIQNPFWGYGLEAYQALERVYPEIDSVHNIFLSILLELGIIGSLVYCFFLGLWLRYLFSSSRNLAIIFMSVTAVFFVAGQFANGLTSDKIFLSCLYFFLSLILAGKEAVKSSDHKPLYH